MISLDKAREIKHCRVCNGGPLEFPTGWQPGWEYTQEATKTLEGVYIVLQKGKEFAHFECINKCVHCNLPLVTPGLPFTELNLALFDAEKVGEQYSHRRCIKKDDERTMEVIRTWGELITFVANSHGESEMPVLMSDGRQNFTPIFEIKEEPNGTKRLIIRR